MKKNMTNERRRGIVTMIKHYYVCEDSGVTMLSSSDFEFLHEIWETEINIYGTEIKNRLNNIRDKYLKYNNE